MISLRLTDVVHHIPGLYEAGQLGSYVSNLYQNRVFLSEAMLSGRAAAQTAFGGASF